MNATTMLRTAVQIDRVISAAADAMPWRLPLYRAARDGLIHIIEMQRVASIPKALLRQTKPTIILIGDDDYRSTGPDGWACALRVKYWAGAGMVHAAGGNPEHYSTMVATALNYRRVVMVETDSNDREA